MSFEQNLHQTITYWAPTGSDTYGQVTFAAPVQLSARWEDNAQLIRNKAGQQYTTKSRVFLAQDFDLNGYLFLGTSSVSSPFGVSGAYEIQQKATVPDLAGLKTLYVAYL